MKILDYYRDSLEEFQVNLSSMNNNRSNLILSSIIFIVIFSAIFLNSTFLIAFLASSIITLIISLLIFAYPRMQRANKNSSIEESLLNTTTYMSVLATSGITIDRILEKVVQIEKNNDILSEIQIYLTETKLFGHNVGAAMQMMAERTDSTQFAKMMRGIVNTINTSGDLKSYLIYETKQLVTLKEEETKQILTKLAYMGEIYIALLVVAPILFIIMLSLLTGLDINTGLSSVTWLNTMVFAGIPIASIGFLIFLDNIMGGSN